MLTATSYFENLDRLLAISPQQLLSFGSTQSYVRTLGSYETNFELTELHYTIIDVGGAKAERKKWPYHFKGVQCLVFVVSLNTYDACVYEDPNSVCKWLASTCHYTICDRMEETDWSLTESNG